MRTKSWNHQLSEARDLAGLEDVVSNVLAATNVHAMLSEVVPREFVAIIRNARAQSDTTFEMRAVALISRVGAASQSHDTELLRLSSEFLPEEAQPLSTLEGGDPKYYFSRALRFIDADWVYRYCLREACRIETAESNARAELLKIATERSKSIATFLRDISSELQMAAEPVADKRQPKGRRALVAAIEQSLSASDLIAGDDSGEALEQMADAVIRTASRSEEVDANRETTESLLKILRRMCRDEFGAALESSTYKAVPAIKRTLGDKEWEWIQKKSAALAAVRLMFLEAALIVARQGRTDSNLLRIAKMAYASDFLLVEALESRFSRAKDISPDTRTWWVRLGAVRGAGDQPDQKADESLDYLISVLLVRAHGVDPYVKKLSTDVVPVLQNFDAANATAATRAHVGFDEMFRVIRQIARNRKLYLMEVVGLRLEFNPMLHELADGASSGVRVVRILRDGVIKDYAGQKRAILKALAEPIEGEPQA